ncbi:3'-5' exoribonuclease [Cupriavidus basilensis]|uniref:3'-5' exoribonuclease n=1 Tax=Cupriavidus basilensis TaxID=68895 RepID=A0ABT6AXQ0_9BURK|nr:3'-5' exonuclease [Cupriavidus basilensis]MDF3837133.1 3'-5' exoribonuclease [Cupriavidus basilensis]
MSNRIEIMVDIEAHDTAPTAAIVSIGAAAMDMVDLKVVGTFYANVDVNDCLRLGLTQSEKTLLWWDRQSDEAKAALLSPEPKRLRNVLNAFRIWCDEDHNAMAFWGNGSDFDNVILQNAHKAVEMECWPFWQNRCHRTMKTMFPSMWEVDVAREGVRHNAMDDAIHQANQLLTILRGIRGIQLKEAK